ncbi:hypothetical protein [Streptomyces collinus]|uniref:hypothetical protein n=1 Tax=Streptomyces collinus TaxID=42684 RepID=UPI0036A0989F
METEDEVQRTLSQARVRDSGFIRYEVNTERIAQRFTKRLSVGERLILGTCAGPLLWATILHSFGEDPAMRSIASYLRLDFPPENPIPVIPKSAVSAMEGVALGLPGDPVKHGKFPSQPTKLARLALAASQHYSASKLRYAAQHAYDPHRPYHAHEALACAFVHPEVDGYEVAANSDRTWKNRGSRSRRKSNQIILWARRNQYLRDETSCRCEHDCTKAPREIAEALELAATWDIRKSILRLIEHNEARWRALFQCVRCHKFWEEAEISSGQASLFFGYPVNVDGLQHWLEDSEGHYVLE